VVDSSHGDIQHQSQQGYCGRARGVLNRRRRILVRPWSHYAGRRSRLARQLHEQILNSLIDFGHDWTDLVDKLARWILQLPVEVTLARVNGTGISATHRDYHVCATGDLVGEGLGKLFGGIEAPLLQNGHDRRVELTGRLRPGTTGRSAVAASLARNGLTAVDSRVRCTHRHLSMGVPVATRVALKKLPLAKDVLCCASLTEAPLSKAETEELAPVLAALGDLVRLRLLSIVAARGEVCSCNLQGPLNQER